jgi:ABC-2 type transport system permease protein
MRNSFKVAKWEMRRNMKNKSFIISLFLTPILFLVFAAVPTLLEKFQDEPEETKVYIKDELQVWDSVEALVSGQGLNWDLEKTEADEEEILAKIEKESNSVYIPLTEAALQEGKLKVYMGEDVDENDFLQQSRFLEAPIRQLQFSKLG